jgi:hypothetical protein
MIYTSRTPTVRCTCSKCGKPGTEGTFIGTRLRAGGAVDWNCTDCYKPPRQRVAQQAGFRCFSYRKAR